MKVVNGPAHGIEIQAPAGMRSFFIIDHGENRAWHYVRVGTSFFCESAISPIPRYLKFLNDAGMQTQILNQIEKLMIDRFTNKHRFLSNFFPAPLQFDGAKYAHAEAAYQAAKCANPKDKLVFQDPKIEPQRAKALGKKVELREHWEAVKYDIMVAILTAKFADAALAKQLRDTGDAELVEGNTWHDNTWGVCGCAKCPGAGRNLLGKALMEVRAKL